MIVDEIMVLNGKAANKIKYQVVIGDAERDSNTVKVRKFGSQEQISYPVDEFIEMLKQEIANKVR